jgi:hypothetical protein
MRRRGWIILVIFAFSVLGAEFGNYLEGRLDQFDIICVVIGVALFGFAYMEWRANR